MNDLFSIQSLLKEFSFSDSEARIYLAILSLGKAKAAEIAIKADLNRTAVYSSLEGLIQRGFVAKVEVNKTFHFMAVSPTELATKFQSLTDDFKTVVPELEALNKVDRERPIVEISESQIGYYKVYEEISNLPQDGVFRVIEGKESYLHELGLLSDQQLNNFFSKLIQKNIKTKGIFTRESLGIPNLKLNQENLALDKQRDWDIKVLDKEILPLEDLALIYGNRVSFLFPKLSLVVTIRHQALVDILIAMFDCIFYFAEAVPAPWK